jgi:hypothetical protein
MALRFCMDPILAAKPELEASENRRSTEIQRRGL